MSTTEVTPLPVNGIPNCSHSAEMDKIIPALIEALPAIDSASKDATNPHFNSKYADLTSIMDVAKPALSKSGIAILQPPITYQSGAVSVATVLIHTSGQWIAAVLDLMPADARPQSVGSAITYARRYGLSGLLGITAEDDDGNAASGLKPRETQKQVAQRRIAEEAAKPKTTTSNWKMLEAFKGIKADLHKLTGDDRKYYAVLGDHGYEKSSEITDVTKGREIYERLRVVFNEQMELAIK